VDFVDPDIVLTIAGGSNSRHGGGVCRGECAEREER
jgi:hypothetical protein